MPITQDFVAIQAIAALVIGVLYAQFCLLRTNRNRATVIVLPVLVLCHPLVLLGMFGLIKHSFHRKNRQVVRTLGDIYATPQWWVAIALSLAVTLWRMFAWS